MRGDGRHTSPGFQVIKKRGMIKQIKEINFPEYATLSQAKVSISDMGDMSISAQVKIDGDIKPDFSYDWEVEFKGERYIQPYRSPQGSKDTSSICSTIDLTFYHKAEWLMRSQMFIEMSSTESGTAIADKYEASLGLSLADFVTAFNRVLSHFFGDAIVMLLNPKGTYSSERKFVSISYSYIWDVLQKMNEIYDVRWRIKTDSETGVFQILVGYPADDVSHIFEYGFSGGLMSVQRQVQSSDIRNRLLGRGGEKNLPAYYFKQAPDDSLFESDPDWIPELADIYFSELRGKTFRDYVKGWKAKHYGGEPMEEPTEAYTAGYTDAKFDPVEYVDDKDSIAKYGVIIGGLGNNDDIYPSIQGAEGGVDILVDAEQAADDYTDETAENESQIINIDGDSKEASDVPKNTEVTLKVDDKIRHRFTVPEGYIGFIQVGDVSFKAYRSYKEYGVTVIEGITFVQQSLVTRIFNADTDTEIPRDKFSNLDPGTYYWVQEITLLNASKYTAYKVKVTFNGLKLTIGKGEAGGWKPTFDIWVRNIWGTQKLASESDKDYADRVWLPILGDRLGNEAKVVFSSGWLSFSSDWEFTIVGYAYDTSKEGSEWRLTLQKSDAEQEATGKFIPNEGTNAAAGDSFFFIGIDMPYRYVLWAEQRLDEYKRDQLAELAQINPTWVVETDKVRLNQAESGGGVLADSLSAGCSLRLADKRFIDSAYLNLYIQSISYEWNESTVINPDIEIVLSDKPSAVINAVSQIQGDIEELNKNVTSLSSIKREILAAIDRMYLRKDGLNDISLSRTEFRNLINGLGFKPGRIGGSGWGIYKDSVGKAVGEFDRIVVRDSIDVSSVSVEQVKHTSGTTIISEANIICTEVVEMSTDYRCYFDTKGDELPNMFKAGDIAWCLKYNQDSSRLKYYKRRVTEAGTDYISLSKTDRDGDGVPESGDSIVQFGSFTDTSRQSAIIINPHDGGSIEVYSGLNGYDITERNMVGLGFSKATGKAFLYGYGEFFFGDRTLTDNFITFQQKEGDTKPNLYVNGNIIIGAGSSGLTNLSEWAGKQEQIDGAVSDAGSALTRAESAESAASEAKAAAESAKASADRAIADMETWAADDVISPVEKIALKNEVASIEADYGEIQRQVARYDLADETALWNAYDTAYSDYRTRLNLIIGTEGVSPAGDIASLQSSYYAKRLMILEAIAAASKKVADDAATDAEAAKQVAENALNTATGAQTFIDSTISPEIAEINRRLDGTVVSWFYPYSPSADRPPQSEWTETDMENHVGDTFTNTQEYISDEETPDAGKSWRWVRNEDGTYGWIAIADSDAIKALNAASKAQSTADGKSRTFYGTPSGPYDKGDLWSKGSAGDLMICIKARTDAGYAASDWVKACKYTDDTALTTFINGDYASDIASLGTQIDGKAETWYQATDPKASWTSADYARHAGDLWYDTSSGTTYRWDGSAWKEQAVPDAVFDRIDGKSSIYNSQPNPPYKVGDLWVQGPEGDILRCIASRESGSFTASDWSPASKYTDDSTANSALDRADEAKAAAANAKADADAARQVADNAASAASAAQEQANAAKSRLDDMASDSIISPVEKTALLQQKYDIASEYRQIISDCGRYGVSSDGYAEAYDLAMKALEKYTADMTSDSAKESDYANIADYYAKRQTVLNYISAAARKVADDAQKTADDAADAVTALTQTVNDAVAAIGTLDDDTKFTIPEKRTMRQIMQAITSQKGTAEIYSGTIARSMVGGAEWVRVTQADADADPALLPYVGFYRSQNRTASSYSTVRLTFEISSACIMTLEYASDGEANFDYLAVSKLDPAGNLTEATLSSAEFNTKGSRGVLFSRTYVLPAGTHTLQIMYRKDITSDIGTDSGYYRIATERTEGYNSGLSGQFHEHYDVLDDANDPDGALRKALYEDALVPLVNYMRDTCGLWEDTVTDMGAAGDFRDRMAELLRAYYSAQDKAALAFTRSDYEYLTRAFAKGKTVMNGGVVMSEAVAVRNSEGEVEGMLNGSENFEDGTHGKAIVISGIPSVSSSGSTDLLSRVMEAETILFEDGTLKTKKLQAEAGTFSGVLKAVSGSFKSLSCLDADGNELGYISFGTQGTVDFTGFDLRHDGTFRGNNIFCRGTLGARSRTAVVITGTSGKYYYNGLENASDYVTVSFTRGTTGGNPFYYVPLYGTAALANQYGSQIAGMPVDLVIIQVSGTTTMRYCFTAPVGKKFTVVNANDDNNNIYIYSNGTAVQLNGGTACEMVNIGYANMLPSQTSATLGGGQMIISKNDNNW